MNWHPKMHLRYRHSLAILTLLFSAVLSVVANAQSPLHLMVPAYANPCCDGGIRMWPALFKTARQTDREFQLWVILNPSSGPGVKRDTNFLSADGKSGPVVDLRSADAKLIGYVSTDYGKRPIAEVRKDMEGYLKNRDLYRGHVDGIFFDEVSTDLAKVGFYRQLVREAKAIDPSVILVGNPGVTETTNPSGQTQYSVDDYASLFDVLMSFEQSAEHYRKSFQSPAYDAGVQHCHAIHTASLSAELVNLAKQRGAKFLYLTDDKMPNPYDKLPTYWDQLVTALR